jgi:omega-hydroxy-beta-dihydromenaquinone-9 sulfotransferase
MPQPSRPSSVEHPLALGSFRVWLRLLERSGGVDRPYVPRALFVTLSTLLTSPLRIWERLRYTPTVRQTAIHPAPVFILGHWRSGTTHLHNLMCQDRTLGFLTTFQAMAPGFCLTGDGMIKRLLAKAAAARHPTRVIDNVPLILDAPQEDEFALCNVSPVSFLHAFILPRKAREIFEESVLLDGVDSVDLAKRLRSYEMVLRKATLKAEGRRLLLKNCSSSGHIDTLLQAFPEACFIHIHRNPYDVFLSTRHLYRTAIPRFQIQGITDEEIEACVLEFYIRLMRAYLVDRSKIPAGRHVEVRFEDLEAAPLEEVGRIYDALGLPGFADAEEAFRAYIDSVSGYEKNRYELSADVVDKVNRHWAFAFDQWGYERIEPEPSP